LCAIVYMYDLMVMGMLLVFTIVTELVSVGISFFTVKLYTCNAILSICKTRVGVLYHI
jgi:hypothetical protein